MRPVLLAYRLVSVGLSAGVVDESTVGASVGGVSGVAGVVGSGYFRSCGVVMLHLCLNHYRAKSPSLGAVEGPCCYTICRWCVRTASFVIIPSSAKEVTGTKSS